MQSVHGAVCNTARFCPPAALLQAVTGCGHVFCTECILAVTSAPVQAGAGAGAGAGAACPMCRKSVSTSHLMALAQPAKPPPSAGAAKVEAADAEAEEEVVPTIDLEELCPAAVVAARRATASAGGEALAVGSKLRALLRHLHSMRRTDPTAKDVVFTQFSRTHTQLVQTLSRGGIGVVQIHGAMTQKARSKALMRFASDPAVSVCEPPPPPSSAALPRGRRTLHVG